MGQMKVFNLCTPVSISESRKKDTDFWSDKHSVPLGENGGGFKLMLNGYGRPQSLHQVNEVMGCCTTVNTQVVILRP